jgi:hypothetical protein
MTKSALIMLPLALAACGPRMVESNGRMVPAASVELLSNHGEPVTLTPQQIAVVQGGVRRGLKDPESARFGTILAVRDKPGAPMLRVCGRVNAKNSYGGYTGEQLFTGLIYSSGAFMELPHTGGDEAWGTANYCGLSGMVL